MDFMEFAEAMQVELEEARRQNAENLDRLESIMDKGWVSIYGAMDNREGPSLDQVKAASKRNREMSINPHVGGGLELINSYVWADGVHYEGIPGSGRGRAANVQALIDDEVNQENYFGALARKERQAAAYYDGVILIAGVEEGGTKRLYQYSIQEITDDYRNPDKSDEIWAYRREWNRYTPGKVEPEPQVEWIYASAHLDRIPASGVIRYQNKDEKVATNKRLFVKKVNPIVGWAYGVSDVQRGISWAEDYRIAMQDGKSMNSSMASIWATRKNATQAGAKQGAIGMGNMRGAGNVVNGGEHQDLNVLPSAGNVYKFGDLLPILANFAAGIGVSVIALSMNSGNAGGSYGAARSLDRPEQLSTKTRRAYNKELDVAVLKWLGADEKKLDVWFDSILDPTEKYRAEQIIEQRLATGLYEGAEIKRMHAELDGRDPNKITKVPDGWLIPNNRESVELRTIDPNTSGSGANPPSGNPSNGGNFAPSQGSGQGQGQGDQKSDDIRTNRESIERLANDLGIDPKMLLEALEHFEQ